MDPTMIAFGFAVGLVVGAVVKDRDLRGALWPASPRRPTRLSGQVAREQAVAGPPRRQPHGADGCAGRAASGA